MDIGNNFSGPLEKYTFQIVERIFQSLERMFQDLERTFQTLKYKMGRKSITLPIALD